MPILLAVVSMVSLLLMKVFEAIIVSKLWSWYVVPTFGFLPLGWTTCFGLLIIVGMLQRGSAGVVSAENSDMDPEELLGQVAGEFFKAMLMLGGTLFMDGSSDE